MRLAGFALTHSQTGAVVMQNPEKPSAARRRPHSSSLKEHVSLDAQLDSLNDQAERCRRLAGSTYDREISSILGDMAEDYERSARALSRKRAS
jgi:hypothetical protein